LRESIPVETILKAYLEETVEEDVVEEIKEQIIEETIPVKELEPRKELEKDSAKLSFNNIDSVQDENNFVSNIEAPKSIERLEEISEMRNIQRKKEADSDNEENVKLNISNDSIELGDLDIHVIDEPKINLIPDLLLDEIEILD
jgi:hypothetical protein